MERVEYGTNGYPYKLSMSTRIENTEQYPTVEAIPKDQYKARLKANMVAMLTEIKNKLIDKSWNIDMYDDDLDFECCYLNDINEIIQQKIDKLKEVEE